jgi:hypothetical protein
MYKFDFKSSNSLRRLHPFISNGQVLLVQDRNNLPSASSQASLGIRNLDEQRLLRKIRMSCRYNLKSWHFHTLLTVPPYVIQSITSNPHISADVIKRVNTFQILSRTDGPRQRRQDPIFNVELQYQLSDLNVPGLVLPVEGYVNVVKRKISRALHIVQRCFQAQWSPVRGHCSRNPAYKTFCVPDPNFPIISVLL